MNTHCVARIEAVVQWCSLKKVFLKISQNSQENACARASFLIKLQAPDLQLQKKKTLSQVVSSEFCEIFKNTYFYKTLLVATSARIMKYIPAIKIITSKKMVVVDIYIYPYYGEKRYVSQFGSSTLIERIWLYCSCIFILSLFHLLVYEICTVKVLIFTWTCEMHQCTNENTVIGNL